MEQGDIRRLIASLVSLAFLLVILVGGLIVFVMVWQTQPTWMIGNADRPDETSQTLPSIEEEIVDGIHVETGLLEGEGLVSVVTHCTGCHSAQLVSQNRFTKEGWVQVIRWMQDTQGLWDLGSEEETIVDYLSTHYAPEPRGRRMPLEVEWYKLD